jgi:NAD-dependent deacetylase
VEMKTIVVLTGAGISAESGIRTFRDSNGLWEEYRIEDVATFEAWQRNPKLVLEFYNQRRRQLSTVQPNAAHIALVRLEQKYYVQIITQNVDNLHERAGSKNILHLHGELTKARSTLNDNLVTDIDYRDINWGDKCANGSQLRPHIVWFGEEVPNIGVASEMTSRADIIIVIGTSLNVYPAAGLLHYAPAQTPKYLIDPNAKGDIYNRNLAIIDEKAGTGVPELVDQLLK